MEKNNFELLTSFITNEEVRKKIKASENRITKSFNELFSGYSLKAEDILNEVVKVKNYNGTIEVKNINFYTFCEHHFAPFFGTCTVIYKPKNIITGLGKIVRLVKDLHARKLQIQEIMTKDIAEDIMRILKAKGVYVETTAKHLCICSRGPKDDTSLTTVKYSLGEFIEKKF